MYIKKAIIKQIRDEKAIINIQDGQRLEWELSNLPAYLKAGDEVFVEIKDTKQASLDQEKLAKSILKEIFDNKTEKIS